MDKDENTGGEGSHTEDIRKGCACLSACNELEDFVDLQKAIQAQPCSIVCKGLRNIKQVRRQHREYIQEAVRFLDVGIS